MIGPCLRPGVTPGVRRVVGTPDLPSQPLRGVFDPSGWETFDAFRFASGDVAAMSHMGTGGSFDFGGGSATRGGGSLRLVAGAGQYHAYLWYPGGDANRTLDFAAIYPSQIVSGYQPAITKIRATVASGSGSLKIELKNSGGVAQYAPSGTAVSGAGSVEWTLPAMDPIKELLLVVDENSDVTISSVEVLVSWPSSVRRIDWMLATTLAQLLRCYDASTGGVRDKADLAVNGLDNPSTAGLTCLAMAAAADAGLVSTTDADTVIDAIVDWLDLCPQQTTSKLLPHFITSGALASGSQWGTIDTAIALLGAALGCQARSRSASLTQIDAVIDELVLASLVDGSGYIRHGYDESNVLLSSAWDYVGGETQLVQLLFAYRDVSTYSSRSTMADATFPVYNSRGFIAELGALFATDMASGIDVAAQDWGAQRATMLGVQRAAVGPAIGGLSEAEYVLSTGSTSYTALEASPVTDAVSGESSFAATDYSLMAGELSLPRLWAACQYARAQSLWTSSGGLAQSYLHDGTDADLGQANWRISSLRSAFSFLGCYGSLRAIDGGTHVIRAAAVANSRFSAALAAQFG